MNANPSRSCSCLLLACLGLLLGPWTFQAGADVVLVREGQAVGSIFVPATFADNEERGRIDLAVAELNEHLRLMSGAVLPVVRDDDQAAISSPGIVLGDLAVRLGAQPVKTSESQEGFRLLTQGDRLLIGGQSGQAVLFGAMEILRRLGCDWVMPGEIGQIVPQRATVSLPAMDESQAPDFDFRRLWYRGYPAPRLPEERARHVQWLTRHKGGNWRHFASGAAGHMWDQFIRRNQQAFDDDPTMLALVRAPDGTMIRRGPQIETTHPRVIELMAAEIRRTYERNIAAGRWTNDTYAAFPIGPADGMGYSLSSEAMQASAGRFDPIVGELDRTDECVLLANRVLEIVTRDYPNAHVGFYSYSTHADFPARYQPHPNLVQIFAPINFSRFHSALDANSKTQVYYRNVVEQWSRLARQQGNRLIYRGYNWNLADNMLPFTKVRIWGEELPWYKQHGMLGLNVEATKSWSVLAASDYVFMRLAWDSTQDWRQLLEEFCRNAYGKGAAAMLRYHHRLIDTQHGAGHEAGSYHAYHLIYDDSWVGAARGDLAEALAAADSDADRQRIGHVEHNVEALALYLDYHRATRQFDFAAAKAGYDAMVDHWQRAYDQNTDLVANEVPQYLRRFLLRFVDAALQHSSDPYRIVGTLPDQLPTMFDPLAVGHRMNYHRPQISDAGFTMTHTFASTWDAQGLTGFRDGAVWYRHWFELPEDTADQPVGLLIGSVEDEARVWINGQLVGSGRGFSLPFLFDLTDGIHYGEPNLLAIQVIRNSKANEIGLGGIIRPSYIFTGPRLETKAPRQIELRRVLPGGDLGDLE
jgi:hypothetical protein